MSITTIPKHIDPLGHAVSEYFEYGKSIDILVESDIADDDILPSEYFFRSYKQMPFLEKEALNRCKGKILDVGAAAGSHALYMQDNGFDVSAIEISQLCCDVMIKRGIRKVIKENFFFYSGEAYDTLLFLMNGIGIAGTISGLDALLIQGSRLLNKGGVIIFDSSDVDYMYYDDDGSKIINLNSNYYGELSYRMHYKKINGEFFPWLFIDFTTLSIIAEKHGFKPQILKTGDHYNYLGVLRKC